MKYEVTCIKEVVVQIGVEADSQEEAEAFAAEYVEFSDYSPEYSFDATETTEENYQDLIS